VNGRIYVISETANIITFSAMLALKTTVQCPHLLNFAISQYMWAGSFLTYVIDPFYYPNSLIICPDIQKVVAALFQYKGRPQTYSQLKPRRM